MPRPQWRKAHPSLHGLKTNLLSAPLASGSRIILRVPSLCFPAFAETIQRISGGRTGIISRRLIYIVHPAWPGTAMLRSLTLERSELLRCNKRPWQHVCNTVTRQIPHRERTWKSIVEAAKHCSKLILERKLFIRKCFAFLDLFYFLDIVNGYIHNESYVKDETFNNKMSYYREKALKS